MASLRSTLLSGFVPHTLAIFVAAAGCVAVAFWAKDLIEQAAYDDLNLAFSQSGHDWTDVAVDGLSVELTGTAPDEATRFAALSVAGSVVDASRITDSMGVVAAAALQPPEFSIEILKNDDGVSLIGLVPLVSDPEAIVQSVTAIADDAPVSDLLEVADFPVPQGWESALSYGIDVLDILPRSKISIAPGALTIKAAAEDEENKRRLERRLQRDAPNGVRLILNITAPRPVVAPFTLRAVLDDSGGRFDACTADSEASQAMILRAAAEAGISSGAECVLGLGTPSTRWGEASTAALRALGALGAGTLTLSNADVTLVGTEDMVESLFERTVGDLEAALPPVFSLNAVLPRPADEPAEGAATPAEFIATRSPEGQVQLRGRLADETTQAAVESFAAAEFGADKVYPATRLNANVPPRWPSRIMAALEALGHLHNGVTTVTPDKITVRGSTGDQNAQAEITRLFSARLGSAATYELDIAYSEALDALASLPTPEECIALLNQAASVRKITFAPGSSDIEDDAQDTIDAVADIVRDCQGIPIEIGGHTDSQGREIMNEQLSQARADAVLNAIMARRVLVSNLSAKGYGEARPIADNGTEAGREANRRIEFQLAGRAGLEETEEQTAEADDGQEETGEASE
ncbi:MAG: OmpA family protein [Paracoccaceae bacterium]|nr:OmpA family protein [Paracoccaceae bacterium]